MSTILDTLRARKPQDEDSPEVNFPTAKNSEEESIELTSFGKLTYEVDGQLLDNNGEDSGSEGATEGEEDEKSLINSEDSIDSDGVVREYETALKHLGFGLFHILLLIINGFALSSDAVEVLSISFVLPVLVHPEEFGADDKAEAVLGSIIFVGMLFGSYIWGGLADVIGRRTTLIGSLAVSAIFGILSAFSPWFWLFVVFRFFSGFGVGGSLPVIFPFTSEFIRNKYRGPYLGAQSVFFMVGRIACGAFAWAIIPRTGINFALGDLQFHSWRLFIIISAMPSLVGCIFYLFLPESPRFLLEVGKKEKALNVLRLVHRLNHLRTNEEYPVKSILLAGVKGSHRGWVKGGSSRILSVILQSREVFKKTAEIFKVKYLRQSILLLIVMFCLSFGGYGIALWYPTYVNQIHTVREAEKHNRFCNASVVLNSSDSLEPYCGCSNTIFSNFTIRDAQYHNWKIDDVIFEDISFINVSFTSSAFNTTYFSNCKFLNCSFTEVLFNQTDFDVFLFDRVVISTSSLHDLTSSLVTVKGNSMVMNNVTINGNKIASKSFDTAMFEDISNQNISYDVDQKYDRIVCRPDEANVYRDNFLIASSALPGHVASGFAVYFLPRNYWLGSMLLASTVTVFLLFVIKSESLVVVILCLFTLVTTPAWNDSSLIIAELYPTHLRSSAAGIHLLMARIGAIVGTNLFGLFIRVNPSIPILLVASVLFVGAVVSFALPKTTRKTLLK